MLNEWLLTINGYQNNWGYGDVEIIIETTIRIVYTANATMYWICTGYITIAGKDCYYIR